MDGLICSGFGDYPHQGHPVDKTLHTTGSQAPRHGAHYVRSRAVLSWYPVDVYWIIRGDLDVLGRASNTNAVLIQCQVYHLYKRGG